MNALKQARDLLTAVPFAARIIGTRIWYLIPLMTLVYPALLRVWLVIQPDSEAIASGSVLSVVVGPPLFVVSLFLGVRIIAGECDARTLEIAYTVPGGPHRIWIPKIIASVALIVVSEALLLGAAHVLLAAVPPSSIYGCLQYALFYFTVAMALSTLFRGEITGGLGALFVWMLGVFLANTRLSPQWNPVNHSSVDASELMTMTVKHRVAFALAIAGLVALAFSRAQRREKMLDS